jgi:hypothetical protein
VGKTFAPIPTLGWGKARDRVDLIRFPLRPSKIEIRGIGAG